MAFGFNNPPAYMGFVGFVRLKSGMITGDVTDGSTVDIPVDYIIRARSASINVTQEITAEDVIDSRYDKGVYRLGPKNIDGNLDFPAVYDRPSGADRGIVEILYRYAVTRRSNGSLNDFNMDVKYAPSASLPNQAEFTYKTCIINTWKFSVAQQEIVSCAVDIIGLSRDSALGLDAPARKDDNVCTPLGDTSNGEIGNTRVVTWNDARIELVNSAWADVIGGEYVRSYEVNINNNAERFYTMNANLFAQAIAPRKRDISGTMAIMGRHQILANQAYNNDLRCSESSQVRFGFVTSATDSSCDTNSGFAVTIPNVVFRIEELSLTNDIFETQVQWIAFPNAGNGVCDPLISSIVQDPNSLFTYTV